jgi:LAS superfamily LD-carboxypeptidase LdcB
MTYPVLPIIMPSDLDGHANGFLPSSLLRRLNGTTGELHHLAATAFNCLQLEAFFAGVSLKSVGTYRSYGTQVVMFNDRYSPLPTLRVPKVTRRWNGKTYWLKRGKAPSAVPGTSNHGWGLAIDIAGVSGDRLAWMLGPHPLLSPVVKYGFTWEVESGANAEPWHIRYVCGDEWPPAVDEALEVFPALRA